jgi:hypothetical protein
MSETWQSHTLPVLCQLCQIIICICGGTRADSVGRKGERARRHGPRERASARTGVQKGTLEMARRQKRMHRCGRACIDGTRSTSRCGHRARQRKRHLNDFANGCHSDKRIADRSAAGYQDKVTVAAIVFGKQVGKSDSEPYPKGTLLRQSIRGRVMGADIRQGAR